MTAAVPGGCRYCVIEQRDHARRWSSSRGDDGEQVGWHQWTQPTDEQVKERMLARHTAEGGHAGEERPGVEITPEIASQVLHHFGRGGFPAPGFTATLILAIAQADVVNRARLAEGFPGYVAAVNLAQLTDTGTATLIAIARGGGVMALGANEARPGGEITPATVSAGISLFADGSTLHLWEVEHPYFCSDSNFRVPLAEMNGNHIRHSSWANFMDAWGDTDPDLNLVFRWDWHSWRRPPDPALPDDRPDELSLFFMLQRKGDFWAHTIAVTDEDEPAVRAWLTERAKVIAALWAPLALTVPAIEETR